MFKLLLEPMIKATIKTAMYYAATQYFIINYNLAQGLLEKLAVIGISLLVSILYLWTMIPKKIREAVWVNLISGFISDIIRGFFGLFWNLLKKLFRLR
jgi:hypothetical protein